MRFPFLSLLGHALLPTGFAGMTAGLPDAPGKLPDDRLIRATPRRLKFNNEPHVIAATPKSSDSRQQRRRREQCECFAIVTANNPRMRRKERRQLADAYAKGVQRERALKALERDCAAKMGVA